MKISRRNIKNSVFKILKIGKAFSNFDLIRQLGKKYTGLCNC